MATYRIVICGVLPDRSIDAVALELARISKKSPEQLRTLLDGRRVTVKRTDEVNKAVKYKHALKKIGCVCTIEAADTGSPHPSTPAVTMSVTRLMGEEEVAPSAGAPEIVYPKRPFGPREVVGYVRRLAPVALLALVYVAYRLYVDHA
jgi:hypothetical protein